MENQVKRKNQHKLVNRNNRAQRHQPNFVKLWISNPFHEIRFRINKINHYSEQWVSRKVTKCIAKSAKRLQRTRSLVSKSNQSKRHHDPTTPAGCKWPESRGHLDRKNSQLVHPPSQIKTNLSSCQRVRTRLLLQNNLSKTLHWININSLNNRL